MSEERFLYQINWNKNKFPEECAALEEAKRGNGVAWYLRKLIQEDLKGRGQVTSNEGQVYVPIKTIKNEPKIEPEKEMKNTNTELPDDSGGFM